MSGSGGVSPDAVHGLVGADREVALLLDIIAATSSGPGVEPMAAAVARMITAATASDVSIFDSSTALVRSTLQAASEPVASARAPLRNSADAARAVIDMIGMSDIARAT